VHDLDAWLANHPKRGALSITDPVHARRLVAVRFIL